MNAKAAEYLAEGRVRLVSVALQPEGQIDTLRLTYHVQGSDTEPYFVKGTKTKAWEWSCDCPARVPECAHVHACKQIISSDFRIEVTPPKTNPDIDRILGN